MSAIHWQFSKSGGITLGCWPVSSIAAFIAAICTSLRAVEAGTEAEAEAEVGAFLMLLNFSLDANDALKTAPLKSAEVVTDVEVLLILLNSTLKGLTL